MRLRVVASAETQIREAARWWHENKPAAPDLFEHELTRGFELITSRPDIGAPALDFDLRGLRRLHLAGIRYWLYYRPIRTARSEYLEVLALWHTSRGGKPPIGRKQPKAR